RVHLDAARDELDVVHAFARLTPHRLADRVHAVHHEAPAAALTVRGQQIVAAAGGADAAATRNDFRAIDLAQLHRIAQRHARIADGADFTHRGVAGIEHRARMHHAVDHRGL